jgi:uncharacterized protein (TIGR02246 family)
MKPSMRLSAALALSFAIPSAALAAETAAPAKTAAAPAATAAPAGPSDRAQIAALEKAFTAAVNAKDVTKIMAVYAKKGLFVFDAIPPRAYPSWDAYKADWDGFFKEGFPGPIKFTISDLSITVDGNLAYGHSIQTIESPGAAIPTLVVRVTDVYRKADGKWRIVHEHVSVPVDLATDKGDLLSKP